MPSRLSDTSYVPTHIGIWNTELTATVSLAYFPEITLSLGRVQKVRTFRDCCGEIFLQSGCSSSHPRLYQQCQSTCRDHYIPFPDLARVFQDQRNFLELSNATVRKPSRNTVDGRNVSSPVVDLNPSSSDGHRRSAGQYRLEVPKQFEKLVDVNYQILAGERAVLCGGSASQIRCL